MEDNGYVPLETKRLEHLKSLAVDATWEPLGGLAHRNCGGQAVRCLTDTAVYACSICKVPTHDIVTQFVRVTPPAGVADESVLIEE